MKEMLEEHRIFRNQLIFITILLFVLGLIGNIAELIGFGIIYGLIAIWNIFSYKENKKDFERLKNL